VLAGFEGGRFAAGKGKEAIKELGMEGDKK